MLERSPEAKGWWQGLKDMIAEAWRGMVKGLGDWKIGGLGDSRIDLKALEGMTPEKGMEWLVGQMAEGRRLGDGEAAKNAKGAEVQGGEKPVKTVEVRNTGDGTLRFQIVRNGQKKTYKRPEEALRDFIAELDGVEMDAEQQGIYDVATGGRKTTDIRKDDLGNLIKLHKGNRGKGAQKIIAVHYAGKRGKVTAKEVIDMGMVIREGTLTYDGTPEHPASRRYEMLAEDGARLRVVVDLDKQGNEAVINLYSDRKDGNPGHKASSGAETTSQEEAANQAAEATEDGHAALTGERSRTVLHSTAPGKGSSDGADYSKGGGEKQVRPSIRGIFTGTAGWNYVSFRDDNIRVDHKWTDGQIRYSRLKKELGNGTMRDMDQKRLTEVIRGLEAGRLKHPRFTREEAAASKGTEHGRLWNYILSLESADVHAGGSGKGASRVGKDAAQGGEGLGQLGRMATRYGSDPKRLVDDSFKYLDEGAESRVYVADGGKKVLKIRKLSAYDMDGVKDTLSKIIYHNYLFPKDAYTLRDIAVWKNKGHDEFYLVLEQPLVTPKTNANGNIIAPSEEQIMAALQKTPMRFTMWDEARNAEEGSSSGGTTSADFVQSARKIAYNGDFMVYDFKPGRNTFIDATTGEVRFIDPRVGLNDPGAGFSVSRFGRRNANGKVMPQASDPYEGYTGYEDEDGLNRDAPESSPAQIRPQRRTAAEEIERTERALKAVREGRVRVAATGGEAGEASEPGAAASEELLAAQRGAPSDDKSVANPVALPTSGLVGLYRALRSNPALPKVLTEAKRKGAAWVSRLTKGSEVELNPEAFGIIDETDRARIKEEMKAEGLFRNEDPVWNMKHTKADCDSEQALSEFRLEDRLNTLAEDRARGKAPGGNRVAANALAHEIGRLVMAMPMSEKLRTAAGKEGAAALRDIKTVGEGVVKAVKKGIEETAALNKASGGEEELHSEEVEAVAWWRGATKGEAEYERIVKEQGEEGLKAVEAEEARAKAELAAKPDEVAGELFGMFLAAPETLRERAPAAYERIVEAIGGNVGHLQGGVLTNCWNGGDITIAVKGSKDADNGAGGLIGYAQSNSATIYHCGNAGTVQSTSDFASHANNIPINVGTIIGRQKSSATTVAGGTIAQADAAPAGARSNVGGAAGIFFGLIYGLDFAIVADNVATFVSSLAAGNTYKVMLSGATATFAFAEPGTISFDEALFAPTYAVTAADGLTLTDATSGTVKTYTATATPATWIGGAQGEWETASNWDGNFVPTKNTVVTFTNDAQVAILGTDRCKELVLSNANVTLVRAATATQPILQFYNDEERAVSVASGATGSLGVNNLTLFNERKNENDMTIGCAFEILGDVTFRGISITNESLSASFTITNKTTISADALVKTIDYGTTKFLGGIEVAKGVTAKINTTPHGSAQIGTGVTLVATDNADDRPLTAIWLMQKEGSSCGVSLVNGAKVSVDAAHAGDCYMKKRSDKLDHSTCDIYEVYWNPTVFVTTYGVTVTGVENEQKVVPGTNLVINVSGFAEGYEPSVKILKHEDYSVLLTTNAVSFTYTVPDFDIDVVAGATPPSYNDPEDYEITDQGLIDWLLANGFTQGDIDALGNDAAATDKLYECWLLNCSIKAANPGGTISATGIAVTNGVISITVRLDRQKPLGFINGVLHIYGTDDLADDFSLISDEIVGFSEGDSTFYTDPTEGAVTQSVTATFSPTDVTAKFFRAVIEFPIPGDPEEDPGEEPEPDPEE